MIEVINSSVSVFFLLIVGHCLADYPLQGDFISKAKNEHNPIPNVPWYQAMAAHCIIHGGFVGVITGSWVFGIGEAVLHFFIDSDKCAGRLSYNQDQFFHFLCKVGWWLAFTISLFVFPDKQHWI
jgi:hypothetical protein